MPPSDPDPRPDDRAEEADVLDLAASGGWRRRPSPISTASGRRATVTGRVAVPGDRLGRADRLAGHGDRPGGRVDDRRRQEVERPDERRHERRRREVVDLGGCADLLDPALAHHDDPVGQRQRLLLVVGDVDGRDPELALDRPDLLAKGDPDLGVEGRQRLVEEEDLGLDGEGPGEGDALLLPARELVRVAAALLGQVDQLEQLADALPDLVLRSDGGPSARSRCCRPRSCSERARTTGTPSRRCAGSGAGS